MGLLTGDELRDFGAEFTGNACKVPCGHCPASLSFRHDKPLTYTLWSVLRQHVLTEVRQRGVLYYAKTHVGLTSSSPVYQWTYLDWSLASRFKRKLAPDLLAGLLGWFWPPWKRAESTPNVLYTTGSVYLGLCNLLTAFKWIYCAKYPLDCEPTQFQASRKATGMRTWTCQWIRRFGQREEEEIPILLE